MEFDDSFFGEEKVRNLDSAATFYKAKVYSPEVILILASSFNFTLMIKQLIGQQIYHTEISNNLC